MSAPAGYNLVVDEPFTNEAAFLSRWSFENGMYRNQDAEVQAYIQGVGPNIGVGAGGLSLIGKKETVANARYIEGSSTWPFSVQNAAYSSGSIYLNQTVQNGYLEVECKNCAALGGWFAFWLGGDEDDKGYGEVDLLEHFNTATGITVSTGAIHIGDEAAGRSVHSYRRNNPTCGSAWTKYGCLLDEKVVEIYFNDLRVHQWDRNVRTPLGKTPLQQAFRVKLNLALGTTSQAIVDASLPTTAYARNFKLYQKVTA